MGENNIKSIHIDESGDFSIGNDPANLLVISVALVYNTPNLEIQLQEYENNLRALGFCGQIHTAPLVRKEKLFKDMTLSERRSLFWATYRFSRLSDCEVYSFSFDKNTTTDSTALKEAVRDRLIFFLDAMLFEKGNYTIYYDGGQKPLEATLYSYFEAKPNVEYCAFFDKDKDRFYQLADFDTYIYLLAHKIQQEIPLSKSEQLFFQNDELELLVKYTERRQYEGQTTLL